MRLLVSFVYCKGVVGGRLALWCSLCPLPLLLGGVSVWFCCYGGVGMLWQCGWPVGILCLSGCRSGVVVLR